jgi:hypothetical protein
MLWNGKRKMDINNLLQSYYDWLRNNTVVEKDVRADWSLISTPFTGINNDLIEIFVKLEDEKVILSDDGNTLTQLAEIGVNVKKSKTRKKIVQNILMKYGVKLDNNELFTECSIDEFPKRKHLFLQCLTELNNTQWAYI